MTGNQTVVDLDDVTARVVGLTDRIEVIHQLVRDRVEVDRASQADAAAAYQAMTDEAAAEIISEVGAAEPILARMEQILEALPIEVAEVGQAISDQVAASATATDDKVRTLSADVEVITESTADSLALLAERFEAMNAAMGDGHGPLVALREAAAEAVDRTETLTEAVAEAIHARPTDRAEITMQTLERLGTSVGDRVEAAAADAVATIDQAVDRAIERAVTDFKDVAPPIVDRSTTAAIVRLEERVAELTRQRDQHDRETKTTLDYLETTVGRLASAQAEDLERIVDAIESSADAASRDASDDGDGSGDKRLARVEVQIKELADLPGTIQGLSTTVATQLSEVSDQIEVLRRRLPVRGRAAATLDDHSLRRLADLIVQRSATKGALPRPGRQARVVTPATRDRARSRDR